MLLSLVETCAMSKSNLGSVLTVTGNPRQATLINQYLVPSILRGYDNMAGIDVKALGHDIRADCDS